MANSTSGVVARFVNVLVQVWLYQYLIKRISPEEYSLYPVVMALMVFVPPLLTVLTSGIARDAVEAHTRNDDQRVTEITSTLFPVLLTVGLVLAIPALIAIRYLDSILKIAPENLPEARLMVLLLFGSVSFRLILVPFGVGLYVRQKFVLVNTLATLQTLIRVCLLFILLLGEGAHVLWVVVAVVTADIVTVLATTILSIRVLPALKFRLDCIRWKLLSPQITFGVWNMIGSIALMIRKSSDLLILNRFATPIDVDTFQLASLTDNQIDGVLDKIAEPFQPHMVALYTADGRTGLQSFCTRGSRYCMWAALLVAMPLIVFRHEVWSIYLGSKLHIYADVPLVMVLLLARYWIEMPICLLGQAAFAMNRMRTLSFLVIGSSVSNVLITVYFVHSLRMGAIGSALGTLVSVLIWSLFVVWPFNLHLLELKFGPWFRATVGRGVLPSAAAALFALGWRYWIQPTTIPELISAMVAASSVYILFLLLFGLDEQDYCQLRQLVARLSSQRAYKALASLIEF